MPRRSAEHFTPAVSRLPPETDFEAYRGAAKSEDQFNHAMRQALDAQALRCAAYKIYALHKAQLEADHFGRFVFISLSTDRIIVKDDAIAAQEAGEASCEGTGYIAKIGFFKKPKRKKEE